MSKRYDLADLLYLMERLRNPETGCPWDIKQTFASIVSHTIEEAHEVADAIDKQDWPHLEEELGDLLFQVVFYSQLGREDNYFDFASIVDVLVTKLVRRHPHVFPNGQLTDQRNPEVRLSDEEIKAQWQVIKQQEKALKAKRSSLNNPSPETATSSSIELIEYLKDIPSSLPALTRAEKIQKSVSQRGFDWQEIQGVIEKIEEELQEVQAEIEEANKERLMHEVGDLIFATVNLSRHIGINPEQALGQANRRFSERYTLVAKSLSDKGRSLELGNSNGVSPDEMESAWQEAKVLLPQLLAKLPSAANDDQG